ncbi:MAG: hypothetical protein [Caudoviricetes sp.]|nr:MAG: hypothetical protein [Caudoviricetes sp.]
MNILTQNQSMTSIEIAELVETEHRNVKVSIERLIKRGVIRDTPMTNLEKINNLGFKNKVGVYIFNGEQGKRDSIIIVAQLSPEFTASIVDRWQYLENKELSKLEKKSKRADTKIEYKPMTNAIALDHVEPKPYHFSNEADMINRIILGTTSSKFRKDNDISEKEAIRDYMTTNQLDAFLSLQRANTVYIEDGLNYQERKIKLQSLFDRKHNQILIDEVHLINA